MDTFHQPSVFELLACDSLRSGLREALRYLLQQIPVNNTLTRRISFVGSDEAILFFDILVEYNYLRSYNASYAESLYNLIRVSSNDSSIIQRELPSLVCLALVPYIKHKMDSHFEELYYKERRTAEDLKRIRLYRVFSGTCSLLKLVYMVRFAAGKSTCYSPLDSIIGTTLVGRPTEFDGIVDSNLGLINRASKMLADFLGLGLTVGSYTIQFLDHWNKQSNSAQLFTASLPIPDPPSREGLLYADDKSANICLICSHVRQNECVLSNTGYVFCYSCLHRYVKAKQRCPVTDHPTTVDNIVKLFTSTPS